MGLLLILGLAFIVFIGFVLSRKGEKCDCCCSHEKAKNEDHKK